MGAGVYAGNVMATAVCETAGVWHKKNGEERKLTETNGEMGVPRDNPRVCSAAVGWDAGGRVTAGVCGQCDGNGGAQSAGA